MTEQTDYKQYYCGKYKAMCLINTECSEGRELSGHEMWCDMVEYQDYDGIHDIPTFRHHKLDTKEGTVLREWDSPIEFACRGCEDAQKQIEQKRLKLEEEAEKKRLEEEARQIELEESKKKYYLYTITYPAEKGYCMETNVTKALCKADVIIQLVNKGYHIVVIEKISKKDGKKIEEEFHGDKLLSSVISLE